MKKIIFAILFAMAAMTGHAQVNNTTALLGAWSGKLKVGTMSLTLVLHLEQADGFLGHSEGGSIAFMLGAQKKVDFIVSLAGPGVKGDSLLAAQGNRILSLAGQPANMSVAKYRQIEETISPEVLEDIAKWILSL